MEKHVDARAGLDMLTRVHAEDRSRNGDTIGIDIGGTKMAVGLVDGDGVIVRRQSLPTEAELGFDRAVHRLTAAIEELLIDSARGTVAAIGIGCAGPIDPARGLINNPYTLTGWDKCDIVTPLASRFNVPVRLENDADAAAYGEAAAGAGCGFDPVVMLTFGTGIGGGVVVGGKLYRGVAGEHPELGHVPVDPNGPECYCGIRGCLESIASGTAVARAGERSGYMDARAVFAGAQRGQREALAIVSYAVEAAATAAWTFCHTFLPQRFVLGGGMMDDHFELFAQAIRSRLEKATQFTRTAVSVARATLGNDAGVVGAARLSLLRERDP